MVGYVAEIVIRLSIGRTGFMPVVLGTLHCEMLEFCNANLNATHVKSVADKSAAVEGLAI